MQIYLQIWKFLYKKFAKESGDMIRVTEWQILRQNFTQIKDDFY